jgi:hypothetical protein
MEIKKGGDQDLGNGKYVATKKGGNQNFGNGNFVELKLWQ